MLLSDASIHRLARIKGMIVPFVPVSVREVTVSIPVDQNFKKKVLSYGLSSSGYDVQLADKFRVFPI